MTNRPEMHRSTHDAWDQGGYCNALVIDHDGETATICGYREPEAAGPSPEEALAALIAEAEDWPRLEDKPDIARADAADIITRLAAALRARA